MLLTYATYRTVQRHHSAPIRVLRDSSRSINQLKLAATATAAVAVAVVVIIVVVDIVVVDRQG